MGYQKEEYVLEGIQRKEVGGELVCGQFRGKGGAFREKEAQWRFPSVREEG